MENHSTCWISLLFKTVSANNLASMSFQRTVQVNQNTSKSVNEQSVNRFAVIFIPSIFFPVLFIIVELYIYIYRQMLMFPQLVITLTPQKYTHALVKVVRMTDCLLQLSDILEQSADSEMQTFLS